LKRTAAKERTVEEFEECVRADFHITSRDTLEDFPHLFVQIGTVFCIV
jgi:hypothetical protein